MSLRAWIPCNSSKRECINNMTITSSNVTFTEPTNDDMGYAIFNGEGYLLSGDSPLRNSTDNWSFTCWMYTTSNHNGCLFSNRTEVSTNGISIFWYAGEQILFDDGTRWTASSSSIPLNKWVHLAFVRQKGVGKFIYLNGSLIQSTSTTGTQTTVGTRFSIGQSQTASGTVSGNAFRGRLRDIRIYNHALNANEVASICRTPIRSSLIQWLPFNGNLISYGNWKTYSYSSSGITFDSNGKIGQCALFNGSSSYFENSYYASQNITFAMWVYFVDSTQTGHVFDARKSDASVGYQPIYVTPTTMQIGDTGTSFPNINYTWSANTWYHICVTHDYNQAKVYINGNLIATNTSAGGRDFGVCQFNIGCRCNRTSFTKIKVNDVRIYNRTLTAEEVHRLALGLAMHYRLDNRMRSENLLPNPTTGSGWSYSSYSADTYTYTRSTTATTESYIETPVSIPVTNGQQYTLSCYAKSNGYVSSMDFYKFNSSVANIQSKGGMTPTTSWQLFTWTFTANATENVRIRFDNNGSTSSGTEAILYVRMPTLETGAVSSLGLGAENQATDDASHIIYDCFDSSGSGNTAWNQWPFNWSTDTARYYTSQYFNGSTNCVIIPFDATRWQSNFTMNIWFKKTGIGPKGYETLIGGPSGFEMDTRSGSSTTLTLYMASTRGGNVTGNGFTSFSLNQWYMVTLVSTSSGESYYVNGNLVKTIAKYSMPTGEYYLGAWKDAASQNYQGYLSDFRLYATALSANDIKALYEGRI